MGVSRTSGVMLWDGSSSPALYWAHSNKNLVATVGVLSQTTDATGQTMRGAHIWVVPHSKRSPGCIWFIQLSAFFGHNHDQEPQLDLPQPCEEMGVDNFSGCTWPTLSAESPVQQMCPDICPGTYWTLVGSGTFLSSSPSWNIMGWQH